MRSALQRDIVYQFIQIDVSARGRRTGGSEIRDARNVHCRTNEVVYRRRKPAASVLKASFVNDARRDTGDVVQRDRLVAIIQVSAAAYRPQAAGIAAVQA